MCSCFTCLGFFWRRPETYYIKHRPTETPVHFTLNCARKHYACTPESWSSLFHWNLDFCLSASALTSAGRGYWPVWRLSCRLHAAGTIGGKRVEMLRISQLTVVVVDDLYLINPNGKKKPRTKIGARVPSRFCTPCLVGKAEKCTVRRNRVNRLRGYRCCDSLGWPSLYTLRCSYTKKNLSQKLYEKINKKIWVDSSHRQILKNMSWYTNIQNFRFNKYLCTAKKINQCI
jgi:hypothetical protein